MTMSTDTAMPALLLGEAGSDPIKRGGMRC